MRVVEFAPGSSPVAEGLSYYSAPAKAVLPAVNSSVRQGSLETANINAVGAVVDLISVQRHFDMMQRALSVYYSDFNRIAAEDLPKV
jgi:flagellar basal body rod protein FlgG